MAVLAGLVQLYFKPAWQESKGVGEQRQKQGDWRFHFFPLSPPLFVLATQLPQTDVTNRQPERGVPFHPKNSWAGKVSKNQLTLLPMFPLENNVIKEQQGF